MPPRISRWDARALWSGQAPHHRISRDCRTIFERHWTLNQVPQKQLLELVSQMGFVEGHDFTGCGKIPPRHQTASAGAEALVHSMTTCAGLKARSSTALARVLKFFGNLFSRATPGSINTGV